MSHIAREKTRLLSRVRRIRGQVEGIERALNDEKDCAEILRQIAAARGAINGLMAKVVEDHIDMHVAHPSLGEAERAQGARELVEVIHSYMK
ncbi:hypothetical protein GCM10007862_10250 [Dyella lipolytica]|uniref:Metal/formaldehyde-sensitive transcriptional repressor n=1 Tax=Dyella lipolytica TaxID=1867835 RepID=A0ABW8J0U5_9GAMM|nr:metal/formaldehyde-sensitive transcriptional repressor [Dyella lipolytica]GLQ45974.1 hypothetical protein GCM10007862_10250 [Dyella lipolytica]